ncbi:MAG: helix-turn-helix transcriptional regulator [Candidatus Gastranaerophilales bacterium]|nr:helix-turn-helix transcriptional regulator [Candidatus Gastranaerophilales bacterium]
MTSDFKNLKEKICKNIVNYRKKAKMTQVQLSIASGASEDYIYRIEKGKRTPSLERLFKIAEALKVNILELLK